MKRIILLVSTIALLLGGCSGAYITKGKINNSKVLATNSLEKDPIKFTESLELECSSANKLKQYEAYSEYFRRGCELANESIKNPENRCENGCPVHYNVSSGIYTDISLTISKSSSQDYRGLIVELEWVLPTKFESESVQCKRIDTISEIAPNYETLFEIGCEEKTTLTSENQPPPTGTVSDLDGLQPMSFDGESKVTAEAKLIIDEAFQSIRSSLKEESNKLKINGKSRCPDENTFSVSDHRLHFSRTFGGTLVFTLSEQKPTFSFNFCIFGCGYEKTESYGICYPLQRHPAYKALANWMIDNWQKVKEFKKAQQQTPVWYINNKTSILEF